MCAEPRRGRRCTFMPAIPTSSLPRPLLARRSLMRSRVVRGFIFTCALLALPVAASAQEAVLTGTVTDSTGAVLPGATVRAVHEATGNNFEVVTDDRGGYRVPV